MDDDKLQEAIGRLPGSSRRWLVELLHMEQMGFCGMSSGRLFRKRGAEPLVTEKLARILNMVMCDGDGFTIEPERWRPGYALTDEGRRAAKQLDKEQMEEERR